MSVEYRRYADGLEAQLRELYAISDKARLKGLDPTLKTECILAKDLADLVEGLVGPKGVAQSIRELSDKLPREELAFKVAEEIVYGKFGHLEQEASANQAIRTALAIFTEGLTAAPLQGVAKVSIKTNSDRSRYLAIYFAGPMRSAGGTDQALTLVVGDFVRRLLGLDRYKPTEEEVSRFIEEIRLYERSVTRFQCHVTDEELKKALQWIPVEVTGTESNPIEVSSFRNLPRVETNRVRGGALRVVNDGIVGRAAKVSAVIDKLGFQGWDWLKEMRKKSEKKSAGFMDDVIAGRPIFSFPSRRGGFRLRYGRARNSGLSAVGIHPATMLVLHGFLAGGTQLRLELPGKGGVVVPVDYLEPPIVRLKNGSVVRVSCENYASIKNDVNRILFLGDILISAGDFVYNSKALAASGYVEEWWCQDLKRAVVEKLATDSSAIREKCGLTPERLRNLADDPFGYKPTLREALCLSQDLGLPLHPSFTFFWSGLAITEEFSELRAWLKNCTILRKDGLVNSVRGCFNARAKQLLERACILHEVVDSQIELKGDDAHVFELCLGNSEVDVSSAKTVFDAISMISGIRVRDKAPTFVGARMGRPEKAKRREMKPMVHVLFPVGLSGGVHRDLVQAAEHGPVFVELLKRRCASCGTYTIRSRCPTCGSETTSENSCPRCGKPLKGNECSTCRTIGRSYCRQSINFREMLEDSCFSLNLQKPKILRGVKGLTNETKTPEVLEKGILRAKYNLSVYKDGTIRFDATNAPLTHFTPAEIGVTVEKLKELGYSHSIDGVELKDNAQICELKLQDVIIPNENAEYFVRVAGFIDELLIGVYGLEPFYGLKTSEDLVGHIVVGLAPHTCAGVLGRVVGFTKLSLCYGHPIWHSAKRRDCDGDEDALILGLDALLNFSRRYLPEQIGGIMDAPLLLIPIVNTEEVQRQAHDFDVAGRYPLEFYESSLMGAEARRMGSLVDLVGSRLGTEAQFEGFHFTIPTSNISQGNPVSSYKLFRAMVDKLDSQLALAEMIDAVDAKRVALKVLNTHFIRDIAGNLRAFSTQTFRCKSCNKRYRRLPLKGKCPVCGGQLTLTVYRGGIEKYLDAAHGLVEKYHLPKYYGQRIELLKEEILDMFGSKKPRQISLADFA